MSALLDSLAGGFSGDAVQRGVLDDVLHDGLPGPRTEAWKYTSLRALERRAFAPAQSAPVDIDRALLSGIPAPRLVFINGAYSPRDSDLEGMPPAVELRSLSNSTHAGTAPGRTVPVRRFQRPDEIFARLNSALADDGAVLRIGEGVQLALPIQLVFVGAPAATDLAWHSRHLIEVGAGASASVVEHHLHAGPHAHLGNALVEVHLGAGSRLLHARIQDESAHATLLARTDAMLAGAAAYERIDLELGGALCRHELNVRLDGEGSQLSSRGVLLATGRRHVDTRLGIEHVARDTTCDLLWRGMADARGRIVFHGGIVIRAGADGSDARLSNKNLLLGDNAEIDTQPVLEIHADEVKAAHGATVGQLDPIAMFYLRSRGLPEDEARLLLTTAFCREVISADAPAAVREVLSEALDRALARLDRG